MSKDAQTKRVLTRIVVNGTWLSDEDRKILQDILIGAIKPLTQCIHGAVIENDGKHVLELRERRKHTFELIEMLEGAAYPQHDPAAEHRALYDHRIELGGAQLPMKYIEAIRAAVIQIAYQPMSDEIFAWVQRFNAAMTQ